VAVCRTKEHANRGPSSGEGTKPGLLSTGGIRFFARSCAAVFLLLFLASRFFAQDGLDPNGNPLAPDLAQFYVAGELVSGGQVARLYDHVYVWDRINEVLGVDDGTGTSFFYPPYVAWLCWPLALLPYAVTAWLYLALSLALGLGLGWWVARRQMAEATVAFPRWREEAVNACWLFVASVPFWRCVLFGQNGLIWLLVAWGAYCLARRGRWGLAGLVMALGACKPQVFLGLFMWMALAGGWRARGGLALGGLLLAALGSLGGWRQWGEWLGSLGLHDDLAGSSARMHDLHHVFKPWVGEAGWWSVTGGLEIVVHVLIWGATLWVIVTLWRREGRWSRPMRLDRLGAPSHLLLALLLLTFALAGPRSYQYDLLLLYPLLVSWWAYGRIHGHAPKGLMFAVITVGYFSDFMAILGIPLFTLVGLWMWWRLCRFILHNQLKCS